MTLILTAPKRPVIEAMNPNAIELTPGQPPPFLVPHCRQCGVPVERFTIGWLSSPWYLPVDFQCHGRTGGLKIPHLDVIRASREGGLLWVFQEKVYARRTR